MSVPNPMMMVTLLAALPLLLAKAIVSFTYYAVGGWVYETVVCSIQERRLAKRGFLYGPCCPIYGVGAISVYVLLRWIPDPLTLFVTGAVVATAIEYATGTVLENVFHKRWWSYDGWFLNIKGRVCLLGALVFGGFTLLVIMLIQPAINAFIDTIAPANLILVAAGLALIYGYDALLTVEHENPDVDNLPERVQRVAAALPSGAPSPYELCMDARGRIVGRAQEVRERAVDVRSEIRRR